MLLRGPRRCATRHNSTFKGVKVGQVPKSQRCSSEPHNLSAAWANRRPWPIFSRVFVAHDRRRSLNRDVARSRPAVALAHQCGNGELTNKQKNWYRIRVFGDDRHRDDLPRGETCIGKDIRRAYWFYAKVESRSDRDAVTRSMRRRRRVLSFLGRTGRPFSDRKVKTQPLFAAGSTKP